MSEDHLELERKLLLNLLGPPDGSHWSQQVIWDQRPYGRSGKPSQQLLIITGVSWYHEGSLFAEYYTGPGERGDGWIIQYGPAHALWPPVTFEEILKIITDADWRREHRFPKLDDVQDHD